MNDFPISIEVLLAEVAYAVYLEFDEVADYLIDHTGMTSVDYFSVDGSEGAICSNAERLVVGFTGTDPTSLLDLMTDINIGQTQQDYGAVHLGAYGYYTRVRDRVMDLIAKHRNNGQPIYVTGHSLGGMIARIFCCEYQEAHTEAKAISMLADFGCPNTGNEYFKGKLDSAAKKHYHFVNNCDIFPRMPPVWLTRKFGLDYTSPKNTHYFSLRGKLYDDPSWWIKYIDRAVGRYYDIGVPGTKGIKDHSMSEYRKKIKERF